MLRPDDYKPEEWRRMSRPMTDRKRWIALYVLCVGMLLIVLDVTVVNVALSSIQDDLGFSKSSLAWVVNSYLIAFGGLLLLAGRLGALISRSGMKMTLEDKNAVVYGAGEEPKQRRP